jgi:predicted PurR-regulated permease PerM
LELLPFIGTGIVLIPVGLFTLAEGNGVGAAVLLIVYVLCISAREYLEPRLIGRRTGISPLLTLFGMYTGIRVFGAAGIVTGPIYVLLAVLLYRKIFLIS